MHLQSSSKFLELLKLAGKRVLTSRDTCRTRRVPGGGSLGVGSWGTWHTRMVSGGDSQPEHSGHAENSDGIRRVSRREHLGHVAYPECSRGNSPCWSSRDTWRIRR